MVVKSQWGIHVELYKLILYSNVCYVMEIPTDVSNNGSFTLTGLQHQHRERDASLRMRQTRLLMEKKKVTNSDPPTNCSKQIKY